MSHNAYGYFIPVSRGHGAAQRFVLAQLAGSLDLAQPISDLAWDWMHYKDACRCGCTDDSECSCEPNANELESIRRAVRSLEREGLVQPNPWRTMERNLCVRQYELAYPRRILVSQFSRDPSTGIVPK